MHNNTRFNLNNWYKKNGHTTTKISKQFWILSDILPLASTEPLDTKGRAATWKKNRRQLVCDNTFIIHKNHWNTMWAFTWKHSIFTHENKLLSSNVKRSLLLWLHNKWHLLQQKWNGLGFHRCLCIINRTLHGCL